MRDATREQEWTKRVAAIGEFMESVGHGKGATGVRGGAVTGITIRCATVDRPEVLLIVKAMGEDGAVVGFVGALDLGTAILTWRARDGAKGLRWREDRPWTPKD